MASVPIGNACTVIALMLLSHRKTLTTYMLLIVTSLRVCLRLCTTHKLKSFPCSRTLLTFSLLTSLHTFLMKGFKAIMLALGYFSEKAFQIAFDLTSAVSQF